jgi:hypothetical protein
MSRRAYIDAGNLQVVELLAIKLHGGTRLDFYALPEDHKDRLQTRAWTILRELRKVTIDAERAHA